MLTQNPALRDRIDPARHRSKQPPAFLSPPLNHRSRPIAIEGYNITTFGLQRGATAPIFFAGEAEGRFRSQSSIPLIRR